MNIWLRVILFYFFTLFLTVIIAVSQQKLGFITPETVILPQLGPGLAALLMLFVFKKERFLPTISLTEISMKNVVLVILVPMSVLSAIFAGYNLFVQPISPNLASWSEIPFILAGMILGAFGEELGWRGYLQRMMLERTNFIVSVLSVGILWGLWHVGNYQYGVLYVAYFLLFSTGASGVMSYLLGPSRYNVVLAAMFHVVLNCGYFTMKAALPDVRFTLISGVVWMLAWGIFYITKRNIQQTRRAA